jgi:nitrate reductase NapD
MLNISGIVVHAHPDKISKVSAMLEEIPGVEIHGASEIGKLVVTVEKADDREAANTYEQISNLPGVLAVAMVYHHFEPEEI